MKKINIFRNTGELFLKKIAENLDRTLDGVQNRAMRLGLGAYLENGEYVTYSQLMTALYGLSNPQSAYRIRKQWKDFPVKKKRVGRCTFRIVYLDDFWEWAEYNRRLIDFSKMEENILGAEPEWVKQKRKIDFACRINTEPWTETEDRKLDSLVKEQKMTTTQLAALFNRTEGAVRRRIYELCIDKNPVRSKNMHWTDEETQTLLFMYEEGWNYEHIGAELGRSAASCRGKIERLANPEYFYRENRRKRVKATC